MSSWMRGAVVALIALIAAAFVIYGGRLVIGVALIAIGAWALFTLVRLLRRDT